MAVTYLQRWILIQPLWGVLVWLGLTSSSMAEVEKWQRMVLSFPNTSFSGNPFELEVDGTFTHTATGTQITLPGYYDGNHIWNVAFMPTMVGAWTYMTHSSDAELNGQTGAVDVSESDHPGMLVADPSHPNKWKYTDGDFVVPIGVFASAMLDPSSEADFSAMADFLVANHLQMINFRLSENDKAFSNVDALQMNLTLWDRLEQRMEILSQRGLGVDIMLYTDDSGRPSYGPMADAERLLIRYMVARLASYPSVNFNSGIDIAEYRDQAWVNWYGQQLGALDPYGHPVSSRRSGNLIMQDQTYSSTGQRNSTMGTLLSQVVDGIPEMNNDNFSENATGINGHTPEDIRRTAWKAVLAGGIGFHVRHNVLNCVGGITECDRYFDVASLPTQLDSEHWLSLVNPFVQRKLGGVFGDMEPAPSIVDSSGGKWALADPARTKMLFWLVGTGDTWDSGDGGPITLLLNDVSGTFNATWIDPRTGEESFAGVLAGGQNHALTPSNSDDWVLLLETVPEPHSWMGCQYSFQSCSGIWSEPSNWSPAGLPGANWVAIVDHDFSSVDILAVVETDSTVNSVDLLGSTGPMILEVLKGVTLTVIDGITVGSGATLKGKGAIVGDLINNAGTVTAGLPEPSGFLLGLLGPPFLLSRRTIFRAVRK